jgi:hypothetical protein
VAPVDFSRLDDGAQVGPRCVEPTRPKDDCREILAREFVGALTAVQGLEIEALDRSSAPFVIRAQVLALDPGMLSAKEKRSSRVVMHVRIEHQDGRLLDELRLKTGMKPTPIEPAPGFRVWMDGGVLGEHLRTYLRRRGSGPGRRITPPRRRGDPEGRAHRLLVNGGASMAPASPARRLLRIELAHSLAVPNHRAQPGEIASG